MILRFNGYYYEAHYVAEEQSHGFNFPFQIGTGGDEPSECIVNEHQLEENDIVILATDGLNFKADYGII